MREIRFDVASPEADEKLDFDLETMLEPPYRVFIVNDEITPYDFVVMILQRIFQLDPLQSEAVTFEAHHNGRAYVATYPLNEAQKRVGKAHFAAQLEGYPLTFTIEPEE